MQSIDHFRMWKRLLGSLLLIGLLAGPAHSEVMTGVPSDYLHFTLGDGISHVQWTVSDSAAQVATLSFSIQVDSAFEQLGSLIDGIRALVSYDKQKLVYLEAVVNRTVWPDSATFVATHDAGLGMVDLSFGRNFNTGTEFTATAGTRVYAELKFKNICRPEASAAGFVNFEGGIAENEVMFPGGTSYSPGASNWDNGSVDRQPDSAYHLTLELSDTVLSDGAGRELELTEYATSDFRIQLVRQVYRFDPAKLQYAGWYSSYLGGNVDVRNDTQLVVSLYAPSGIEEGTELPILALRFNPLCDLANSTTSINLIPESTLIWAAGCHEVYPTVMSDPSVSISLIDSAAFRARYLSGPVGMQDDGDILKFGILMNNSYSAGMKQATDTGLTMNINWTRNLDYDEIDHVSQSVQLFDLTRGDSTAIYQEYDAGLSNVVAAGDGLDSLVTLKVRFDTAGFVPNWYNRYVHPKFMNNFLNSEGRMLVPDTAGCIRGDSLSGYLHFWGGEAFDSVEVLMGQFLVGGVGSSTACADIDLYVRGTIEIDSFYVRATVPSWACIYQVTDKMTGVTSQSINAQTQDIRTSSTFASIAPTTDQVKVCRLRVGLKSPCLDNKYYSIGVTLSGGKMWDYAAGGQQFAAMNGGSTSARCSSTGTGCASCGGGIIEPIGDPGGPAVKVDPSLPTVFALKQNFPNPFNPVTTISFDLPIATEWRIEVYNTLGQLLKEFHGSATPGTVSVQWDASSYSSGVYLYRATAADFVETRKMLLLK